MIASFPLLPFVSSMNILQKWPMYYTVKSVAEWTLYPTIIMDQNISI
jgi:hypothetical protein